MKKLGLIAIVLALGFVAAWFFVLSSPLSTHTLSTGGSTYQFLFYKAATTYDQATGGQNPQPYPAYVLRNGDDTTMAIGYPATALRDCQGKTAFEVAPKATGQTTPVCLTQFTQGAKTTQIFLMHVQVNGKWHAFQVSSTAPNENDLKQIFGSLAIN